MASINKNAESKSEEENIGIKDLLTLLRKSLNDQRLTIINNKVSQFLPLGENYCSSMLKLELEIQRSTNNAKPEKLHLIAKTMNKIERPIVDWKDVFTKEVFAYAELLPEYRDLEREAGVPEDALIDLTPKYYGHRNSLKDQYSNEIDEDSLFLMENMKVRGYANGNRHVGLNAHQAKVALSALARYHALGVALRLKRPKFFEKTASHARVLGIDFEQIDVAYKSMLKEFRDEPYFGKHLGVIESGLIAAMNGGSFKIVIEEPWATITHGDFWVNNILFRESEHVDDVKFIDFQVYLYASPLKDLPYFLFGSLDERTMLERIDELLDVYHDKFTEELRVLGCDTEPFSRAAFDREMKRIAVKEFPVVAMSNKFWVAQAQEEKDSSELMANVFESRFSGALMKKLKNIVKIYEDKGWFS